MSGFKIYLKIKNKQFFCGPHDTPNQRSKSAPSFSTTGGCNFVRNDCLKGDDESCEREIPELEAAWTG